MIENDLTALIGSSTTITGRAANARSGAIIRLDDRTPVYIDGLESWQGSLAGQTIQVQGTLLQRSLAPDPYTSSDGGISHGIDGSNYVLESAQWSATP